MAKNDDSVYVAHTAFVCEIDGERYSVTQGERVRSGHPLVKAQSQYFDRVEDAKVHYDVERATAAPGEKRGEK